MLKTMTTGSVGFADIVIVNVRAVTMDPASLTSQAIALRGEIILAIGSAMDMAKLTDEQTLTIDGAGGTLLPGFIESHCHLFLGGAEIGNLDLTKSEQDIFTAVRRYAADTPDRQILVVQGAEYGLFSGVVPRDYLDQILPDRALVMMSADHHTVWANTAVLRDCGILYGKITADGSKIVIGADGIATGELREPGTFDAVLDRAGQKRAVLGLVTGGEPDPAPTPAERDADREMLRRAALHLAAHGITSAVNMDGNLYTLQLLAELLERGALPIRAQVAFHFKPQMELAALDKASAMLRDWQGDWLRSGLVKLFMDGVLDSRTAARLDDDPQRSAALLFAPDRFAEIAIAADRRGLQIAVHAIGDGAVRATIDGYAAARAANGSRDSRHRIEHIELIDPADVPRLATLGIVASLQPAHVPGAMDFPLEPVAGIIGQARWADAFRCATLDAPLAFGSDWPVADASVLRGIQAHLTRAGWGPDCADERVGLAAALDAYTRGGAWASHCGDRRGMLKLGYLADLTLLDGDITTTPYAEIGKLHVVLTICGGRITYRKSDATMQTPQ